MKIKDRLGADKVATGHYATIGKNENDRFYITKSKAMERDQSYALYRLTQMQLAKTVFPLGGYDKQGVRAIAEEAGLPVFSKKDSQDICFIPDGDYGAFLDRYASGKIPGEGNFKDKNGMILGRHKGITHYTIGQRKGLGIALGHPAFVTAIRPETNEVVLGTNEDCFCRSLVANEINMVSEAEFSPDKTYVAKIRYGGAETPCRISVEGEDTIRVLFEKPVRAVTPGQSVVVYDDAMVVGGGMITGRE